jgi:hypothetical protein
VNAATPDRVHDTPDRQFWAVFPDGDSRSVDDAARLEQSDQGQHQSSCHKTAHGKGGLAEEARFNHASAGRSVSHPPLELVAGPRGAPEAPKGEREEGERRGIQTGRSGDPSRTDHTAKHKGRPAESRPVGPSRSADLSGYSMVASYWESSV